MEIIFSNLRIFLIPGRDLITSRGDLDRLALKLKTALSLAPQSVRYIFPDLLGHFSALGTGFAFSVGVSGTKGGRDPDHPIQIYMSKGGAQWTIKRFE